MSSMHRGVVTAFIIEFIVAVYRGVADLLKPQMQYGSVNVALCRFSMVCVCVFVCLCFFPITPKRAPLIQSPLSGHLSHRS